MTSPFSDKPHNVKPRELYCGNLKCRDYELIVVSDEPNAKCATCERPMITIVKFGNPDELATTNSRTAQ